jgi:hypothetical protein
VERRALCQLERLAPFYLEGRLKIDELVSRTYKLDEINEGFTALRSGQVARGVITFNSPPRGGPAANRRPWRRPGGLDERLSVRALATVVAVAAAHFAVALAVGVMAFATQGDFDGPRPPPRLTGRGHRWRRRWSSRWCGRSAG